MIFARLFAICFFILALPSKAALSSDREFQFLAEALPPYSFRDGPEIRGISVDILVEMFARADMPYRRRDIAIVPWARGYAQAQARPNTVLFSTVRTPEREKHFLWVGPIAATQTVIWARREDNITIDNPSDLNRYHIGVSQDTVGHEWLKEKGVSPGSMTSIVHENRGALLLSRGRIHLWVADATMARWEIRKQKLAASKFEIVHVLLEDSLYYAFHPESDNQVIHDLQAALDSMKADGTYSGIMSRYLHAGILP
ncbi:MULTISPECIES: substrate-binding periplasmic protein [Kordiimonas]|jgi:polar amino acid transport system substrate-binding protein|uniref:substrate-binding periplasmic protein n=1 Tax=Kordiimonas TaxID=288021 RepID=UPI00257F9B93|nr:ABC transporter substrate-binding protein [Kordiimonas sp. UBA4487]